MKPISAPSVGQANKIINRSKEFLKSSPKGGLGKDATKLAAKDLTAGASGTDPSSASIDISTPDIPKPNLPDAKVDISSSAKEAALKAKDAIKEKKLAQEAKKISEIKKQRSKHSIDKPGIFFLGGSDMFSLEPVTGSYGGIKEMSEYVEGSRYYGWDQKDEILNEIDKRKPNQPIILVGHSLGGDTLVEIANKLNSLDHGYREVDLLFTIDSVGMNNDLIPANVKKNIHYFSDENLFLNDGPNWAKNDRKTEVENHLVEVDHTDLDDNHELQAHLLSEIETVLA